MISKINCSILKNSRKYKKFNNLWHPLNHCGLIQSTQMMCGFNIAGWKCIKPYTHEIHTYIKMHNTRYPLRFLFHLHLFTIDILCRMCQDEYDIFYKNVKPFFQFLYTSSLFFLSILMMSSPAHNWWDGKILK